MLSKIKNIIIFVVIGVVLVGGYLLFVKKPTEAPRLIGSTEVATGTSGTLKEEDSMIAKELLGVLLNVKNIHLNDSIFNQEAFISLQDSTILLVPDGTEGRPNPFAPIGNDISAAAVNSSISTPVTITSPNPTPTTSSNPTVPPTTSNTSTNTTTN